jgi:hypothetical protein
MRRRPTVPAVNAAIATALAAALVHAAATKPGVEPPARAEAANDDAVMRAWVDALPHASTDDGDDDRFALDDRLRVRGLVLRRITEEARFPERLVVAHGSVRAAVPVPKAARSGRTLAVRFAEPWSAASVTVASEDERQGIDLDVRPVLEAEVRGDALDLRIEGLTGPGADAAEMAAILTHAAEPTFDALGRRWASLPVATRLTALDRLGPSRCAHGVDFLARIVAEGDEPGERAEKLLGGCGELAALTLAARFEGLSAAHRARLAPVFARIDAAKAFKPLLDATAAATGAPRQRLRAALAQSAKKLGPALLDERLRDARLPLRTRLALAAVTPVGAHAPTLAEIGASALRDASADERRRGVWIARDLPTDARAALHDALLDVATKDPSAATRADAIDALWPIASDEARARLLGDASPAARALAANLAKAGAHAALAVTLRGRLEMERWLEPTRAIADALATLAPNDDTIALLRARGEAATNTAFAATYLEARGTAGDREALRDAKKLVRDDRAALDLRLAGVHVYRTLGERTLNGDLVRLAKRAAEPLAEDDVPLAYACVEALADLATDDDRRALEPLLAVKDPGLRAAVRKVLVRSAP